MQTMIKQNHHNHQRYIALWTALLLTLHSTSSFHFLYPTNPSLCSIQPKSSQTVPTQRSSIPSVSTTTFSLTEATGRRGACLAASAADDGAGEGVGEAAASPQTFREAEILGLRLMQQGQHQDALLVFQEGLKLPGSRSDILRTKTLNISPVGGSTGGSTGQSIQTLDEFETQAAHYNIACAYAHLGKSTEAVRSLEKAFKAGFDNYAAARADPDLAAVRTTKDFDVLMEQYDPKKRFPFSLFGSK